MPIATIILAAGSSSRLGEPKQLLRRDDGTTLVRRTAEIALSLGVGPVVVVLGANGEDVGHEIADLSLTTAINPDWATGLASSLQVGLSALPDIPTDAFLILLTDQPHVTADLLRQLIDVRQSTGRGIVASRYRTGGSAAFRPAAPAHLGVPALFDIRYKAEFMTFTDDVGARKLIRQYSDDCAEVPFPLGAVDLDTPHDVVNWRSSSTDVV